MYLKWVLVSQLQGLQRKKLCGALTNPGTSVFTKKRHWKLFFNCFKLNLILINWWISSCQAYFLRFILKNVNLTLEKVNFFCLVLQRWTWRRTAACQSAAATASWGSGWLIRLTAGDIRAWFGKTTRNPSLGFRGNMRGSKTTTERRMLRSSRSDHQHHLSSLTAPEASDNCILNTLLHKKYQIKCSIVVTVI